MTAALQDLPFGYRIWFIPTSDCFREAGHMCGRFEEDGPADQYLPNWGRATSNLLAENQPLS